MSVQSALRRSRLAAHPRWRNRRLWPEAESSTRTAFQRDRDRILHSTAFRRLAHKTQVFMDHGGDHVRTRLTHTIEVSQISRSLARALRLDEDLAEAIALAHDLGHTPFGHAGEEALDACLHNHGGFDHNIHALRLVTDLEQHYAAFNGLNLTEETLGGLVKHNGPLMNAQGQPMGPWADLGVPQAISDYDRCHSLRLDEQGSLEAQVAALADDIAYSCHDIDDGLRNGLFVLSDIAQIPFVGAFHTEILARYPHIETPRLIHEVLRRIMTGFVDDAITSTHMRLAEDHVCTSAQVRRAARNMVAFSEPIAATEREIRAFLFENVYRSPSINRARRLAEKIIQALFSTYVNNPKEVPAFFTLRAERLGRERAVADYIAGMTDRFALSEYRRLFDPDAGF